MNIDEVNEFRKPGYKEGFEKALDIVKYYADKWDGIYQAIDALEEKKMEIELEIEKE